jgi:hypothetical protein
MAFLEDTFTDTNGTLLENHTPEVGGAWSDLGLNFTGGSNRGHVEIQDNVATRRSNVHRNAAVPPTAEYVVSADFTIPSSMNFGSTSTYWWLAARLTDTGTGTPDGYFAGGDGALAASERYWSIYKRVGGVTTMLATQGLSAPPVTGATISVEFTCTDAEKVLRVNGSVVATTTDNEITQVGRVGIAVGQDGTGEVTRASIDNLLAVEYTGEPDPEPLAAPIWDPVDPLTQLEDPLRVGLRFLLPEGATGFEVERNGIIIHGGD